jgi:SHS2 domain-containing protein
LDIKKDPEGLGFEFFDVTADVGFKAYGKTMEKAFENAANAMFEVITDTSSINHQVIKKIKLEAEDEYSILYDWLSELLFLHDAENLIFSKFVVRINQKLTKGQKRYYLEALVFGEEFNQSIHEQRTEVKAVTYHMMDIKFNNSYILQVILDV